LNSKQEKKMKTIASNKIQYLAIVCLMVGLTFLSGCNDEETSSEVVLLSFGPAGVHHGDEITFFGQNMDKVSAIVFKPEVEVTSFVSQTSDRIVVAVPHAAEAGKVVLKTPSGDIESKTVLNFEVPVVISSITSEARPGAQITLTGDKLNWIEEITFPSDLILTKEQFDSQSLNELKVTVPMEAQTGFLIFSTGGTEPLTFATEEEFVVTVPTVTALTPSSIRHAANLTITGTDLDLITSIDFTGGQSTSTFVSKTATQIVVAVPAGTTKGKLTLNQMSPIDVVTSGELTIILPIGTDVSPKPAVPGTDNITITGTDLDLVAELVLPGVANPILSSTFVSQTPTQIVLAVPVGANSGGISYKTIHGYSNNLGASLIVPGAGPAPLAITMYDETMAPGGGDWSWNVGSSNPASTEQFYAGNVSWKFTTPSDGGVSAGGLTPIDASALGTFVFSLYGGPGTDGKQVAAILGDDSGDEWGSYNSVAIKEGEWTEYRIPFTSYATVNFQMIRRFIFKVEGMAGSTIFVDRVGFDPAGPPPLSVVLFDETIAPGGGDWGWNKVVSDMANTEQAYSGDVSWKFETDNGGGLSSGGITPIDVTGKTHFKFALYGGPGTEGKQVAAILNDKWDSYNDVTLHEGVWTEYEIPLTSYGTVDLSAIVRFAFKVEGMTASVIYADYVGFD
jgi:hypothetical protein